MKRSTDRILATHTGSLPRRDDQQKGHDSVGYGPRPLSTRKEYNIDALIRWYLQQMRGDGVAAGQRRVAQ